MYHNDSKNARDLEERSLFSLKAFLRMRRLEGISYTHKKNPTQFCSFKKAIPY